jgi:hypothetical protein
MVAKFTSRGEVQPWGPGVKLRMALRAFRTVSVVQFGKVRQDQGCQMVSFQTKNPNLGKFWRALDGKMLICFRAIWNILRIFGIFYDHLVQFVFIWYISSGFGIMRLEKSGNPGQDTTTSVPANGVEPR